MNFSHLDLLKDQLDHYRPLPTAVVRNLQEDLRLRWTYHSNAIEGNTLTLKETKVVLEGITVGGKTLWEHLEAINPRHAIEFVETLVQAAEKLSEWQIKSIHQLILKYIDDENAGRYRTTNVTIAGAQHRPPSFLQVPSQMARFIQRYQEEFLRYSVGPLSADATDEIRDMPANYEIPSDEPIVGASNVLIANNWNELLMGSLPTSLGTAVAGMGGASWWSGSTADGALNSENCSNWTMTANQCGQVGLGSVTEFLVDKF